MTDTKSREYQDLEHESSSQLLEHDSSRALGRYEEAAYHGFQAGFGRGRMGQISFEAAEYPEAAEDWLSAAACFLQATARTAAATFLDRLHRLEAEGKIPAERTDLRAALRERAQQLNDLEQQVQQFLRDLGLREHRVDVADERTLRFLQAHVRALPGLPLLHYAISRQAAGLGQQELSDNHLVWAATFDPENAYLAGLLGWRYLTSGEPDRALAVGRAFLAAHPSDADPVRIMLANALASGSGGRPADQQRALEVLRPLVDGARTDVRQRIAALALSATFQYELGREQEFRRLIEELDRLEGSVEAPELRRAIADFRGIIPRPEANGTGEAHPGLDRRLPGEDRRRLFDKAMQLSVQPMAVAA